MEVQRKDEFKIGVCSWSLHARSAQELSDLLAQTGLNHTQIGLDPLYTPSAEWKDLAAIFRDRDQWILSGMFGCVGEDYSTLESIRRTGGLVPDATWEQNRRIIDQAAKAAAALNLRIVSMHAGFLPEDNTGGRRDKIIERIHHAAGVMQAYGLTLILETGQETAKTLVDFLTDVEQAGARNIGVNFDPANMILYDKGDPIASLKKLHPWVHQVHIKDAVHTKTPGTWGQEVPVGEGEVDWKAFIAQLRVGGLRGGLLIEREAGGQRVADVRKAVELLRGLM